MIWKKIENHQPADKRDNNISRGDERENPRIHTGGMGIPGKKKGRESTQQRTRIHAHANMEIHYNSTHESIDRRNSGIPPKNINTDIICKQIMCRLITRIRIHAIQHKKERARIKRETKHEGFSHYNTKK
jgi:hypothetical protein